MVKKGLITLLASGMLAGCEPTVVTETAQTQSVNALKEGQVVRHTLSGKKGQDPVITFETVDMNDFELEIEKQ